MTDPVVVRVAASRDLEAVLAVWQAAEAEPSVTDDLEGLQALVAHDPDALLVAEVGGEVVGTLIVGWDGWRASLYRLAVVPTHRRQTIAARLVHEAEQRLRGRGARRITAIVVETHEPAVAFWMAAGYEQQSERLRFVKNG